MSNKFASAQKQRDVSTHVSLQTTKHPGGRPKKAADKKQSEKVFLTFTKNEKSSLQTIAEDNALTITQLIRKVLKENSYI